MSASIVDRWLKSIPNPTTRQAYASRFRRFASVHRLDSDAGLQQVDSTTIAAFLDEMRNSGLAMASINSYRCALASFYRYAAIEAGWTIDPMRNVKSLPVSPYSRSRYPSTQQVAQLLAAVPSDTVQGKRNLAIFLGLFVTTRRVNEWIVLRSGDIRHGQTGHWFTYRAKGGDVLRQAIPADLWNVIVDYLRTDGRWPLEPGEYVFITLPGEHITAGYVRRMLRQYGREAGLPENVCHPHGLRHAGARARKQAGQGPWQLQEVLGHRDIRTTIIYSRTVLDEPVDEYGDGLVTAVLPRTNGESR